jgi:nucleotide-binding universal stress UspA family protein
MFEKILVPLDGSKLAEETLEEVRKIAAFHDPEVTLLRVVFALVFPGVDPTEAQIKVTEEA